MHVQLNDEELRQQMELEAYDKIKEEELEEFAEIAEEIKEN